MKKAIILVLLSILLVISAISWSKPDNTHITLVAVTQDENNTIKGSAADLYLDIKPGSGKIFIDTLPASKLDTQMSTRIAQTMACNYIDDECDEYDFFYTIKADSAIIGGPSASAAVAISTIALLKDMPLRQDVAITGTLNSGYIIGPVAGIKQKIEAAAKRNLSIILIPEGRALYNKSKEEKDEPEKNESDKIKITQVNSTDNTSIEIKIVTGISNSSSNANETINSTTNESSEIVDLIKYGKELGIEVKEISTLSDALFEFTGKRFENQEEKLIIDPTYEETMSFLADKLCNRSHALLEEVNSLITKKGDLIDDDIISVEEKARNLTSKGESSFEEEKFYASASYCFGANVEYKKILLKAQEMSKEDIQEKQQRILKQIAKINNVINNKKIQTITDLQTYMIVKDRLIDATKYTEDFDSPSSSETEKDLDDMAYSIERLNSAIAWARFFGKKGQIFDLEEKQLKESCNNKLMETTEYLQYMELIVPGAIANAREDLNKAKMDKQRENYELCLYKASIAKAQVNLLASIIGIREKDLDALIERKLEAAKKSILKQQKRNIFPLLAYSYYEYANSLKAHNKFSALLYAEYSLELSSMDIYFKTKTLKLNLPRSEFIIIFICGIIIGFAAAEFLNMKKERRN